MTDSYHQDPSYHDPYHHGDGGICHACGGESTCLNCNECIECIDAPQTCDICKENCENCVNLVEVETVEGKLKWVCKVCVTPKKLLNDFI